MGNCFLLLLTVNILLLIELSYEQTLELSTVPMQCSTLSSIATCDSSLYVLSHGLSPTALASIYSANSSLIKNITHRPTTTPNFLVQVPCKCKSTDNSSTGIYVHDTRYLAQGGDTPEYVTSKVFSGLAWNVSEMESGEAMGISLLCGCHAQDGIGVDVVSYTVQPGDTLTYIVSLFSADQQKIIGMNQQLLQNPDSLIPGWVLFVPMGTAVAPSRGKELRMDSF